MEKIRHFLFFRLTPILKLKKEKKVRGGKKKKKTEGSFLVLFLDYHQNKSIQCNKGLFFCFSFFFITLESIKCYISKNIDFFSSPAPLYSKSIYFLFMFSMHYTCIYNFNTIIQQIGKHGFYILNVFFSIQGGLKHI